MGRRKKVEKVKPNMTEILHYVNRYVTVDKGKKKVGNPILRKVLQQVTSKMKTVSPLFKALFQTYLYAGSSFDGLKVGDPDEFDIDLKLCLPKILDVEILNSDRPGFVQLYLEDWENFEKQRHCFPYYNELEHLKDKDNFLSHSKIKQWVESIVTKAINLIEKRQYKYGTLKVTSIKSGPAVTLVVGNLMSIDLVAVFLLSGEKWPSPPVKQNSFQILKPDYVAVPKGPKIKISDELKYPFEKYWRLSFPEQERIHMFDLGNCKAAVRYLKKLRDTRSHNIPSYFIKTIFLWEIEKRDRNFWFGDISVVFLEILKIYKRRLENHRIPYFWNPGHNLIQSNSDINIANIRDYLECMIQDIEKYKNTNPIIVAKYLLPVQEYEEVCKHFQIEKI